jgi:multiple sugar transport system ATP-binding protein
VRGNQVALADGLVLPMPAHARATEGQPVVYGIRPEHLHIASGEEGLATEVVVVEPTGADTQVFTKIAGVEVTSVFRERHAFTPGSTIRLLPDASRAHLFDASSGQSLAI